MKKRNRVLSFLICMYLVSQVICKDSGKRVFVRRNSNASTKIKSPTISKSLSQGDDYVITSETTEIEYADINSAGGIDNGDYVVVEEETIYVTEVDDGSGTEGETTIIQYEGDDNYYTEISDIEGGTHVVTVTHGDYETPNEGREIIVVDGTEIPLDTDGSDNVIIVVEGDYDYDSGYEEIEDDGQEIVIIIDPPTETTTTEGSPDYPIEETTTTERITSTVPTTTQIITTPTTTTTTSTTTRTTTTTTKPTTAVATTTTTSPTTTTTTTMPTTTITTRPTTTTATTTPTTTSTTTTTTTKPTTITTTTTPTTTMATTTTTRSTTTTTTTTTTPKNGNCSCCGCTVVINNNNYNYYTGQTGTTGPKGGKNGGTIKETHYHVVHKPHPKGTVARGRQGRRIIRKIGNNVRMANNGNGIRRRYLTRNMVTRNLGTATGTGNVQVYRVLKTGNQRKPVIVKNLRRRAKPVFRVPNPVNIPKGTNKRKRDTISWRIVPKWKAQRMQKLGTNTRIGKLEQRRVVNPNARQKVVKTKTKNNAGKRLRYNNNVMNMHKQTGRTFDLAPLKLGLQKRLLKRKESKKFVQKKP